MDLLVNSRIDELIRGIDREAVIKLNEFNDNIIYRNAEKTSCLIDGYGGSGGRLKINIEYSLLSNQRIQRTLKVEFTTDRGEVVPPAKFRESVTDPIVLLPSEITIVDK